MRVNVYAEEMTDRIEIVHKVIDGQDFTGLRFYLELPVTVNGGRTHRSIEDGPEIHPPVNGKPAQVAGPFLHRPGDDDSGAVTFWGKTDLRVALRLALAHLDAHYASRPARAPICGWTSPEGDHLYPCPESGKDGNPKGSHVCGLTPGREHVRHLHRCARCGATWPTGIPASDAPENCRCIGLPSMPALSGSCPVHPDR